MTELEKIAYAKSFIDMLSNGVNPLNGMPIPKGEVATEVRISRCFAYVSDVLGQIVEKGKRKEARSRLPKRARFTITADRLRSFQYSEEPITLGEFCNRVEAHADLSKMKRLSRTSLPRWLVHIGLLAPPAPGERHYAGGPTEEGVRLGVSQITYTDEYGTHTKNVLSIEAQRFIVDNIESFLAFRERGKLAL